MSILKPRSRKAMAAFLFPFVLTVVLLAGSCGQRVADSDQPYLLMYAFAAEGQLLAESMLIERTDTVLGRPVRVGELRSRPVLLAECGVGLINAAMTSQLLIDRYDPKAVVFSGIAGGIDSSIQIGDIVVCDRWLVHDYGYLGGAGLVPGSTRLFDPTGDSLAVDSVFQADSILLGIVSSLKTSALQFKPVGDRTPKLVVGGVGVSGNTFIDSYEKRIWLSEMFGALTTDMESAALAQVCRGNGVPFVVFRSASDLAGGSGSESASSEMDQFFQVAADNSSAVVLEFVGQLP